MEDLKSPGNSLKYTTATTPCILLFARSLATALSYNIPTETDVTVKREGVTTNDIVKTLIQHRATPVPTPEV